MRKNNKGFTLIEMLIVVAIIAILVAVSIPLVNNSLERAREATDAANERAAKAEAIVMWLNNETVAEKAPYDAASGKIGVTPSAPYGKCSIHKSDYIVVTVDEATGEVTVDWNNHPGTAHGIKVTDGTT